MKRQRAESSFLRFMMTGKIRLSAVGQYLLSFDSLPDCIPCNDSVFPPPKKGSLTSESTLLFLSKRSFSPVSAWSNAAAANANTSGQQVATCSQTSLMETKNLLLNPVSYWIAVLPHDREQGSDSVFLLFLKETGGLLSCEWMYCPHSVPNLDYKATRQLSLLDC